MLQLLKEVSEGKWKSVFYMEIDRLGRGDMEDQGIILRTFKQAKTLIVTPRKVYDLNDEFDEEYTEFEAFMARKELKIITRRLQGGRLRSVEDGNYLSTLPPYG
jgi:DNA invertase Pin-like site-specific DNA recombinase